MTTIQIKELAVENAIVVDGFDDAIIGLDCKTGGLIYSEELLYRILEETFKMAEDDAVEYVDYNIYGTEFSDDVVKPVFVRIYKNS
jgi:hypothetical protein